MPFNLGGTEVVILGGGLLMVLLVVLLPRLSSESQGFVSGSPIHGVQGARGDIVFRGRRLALMPDEYLVRSSCDPWALSS